MEIEADGPGRPRPTFFFFFKYITDKDIVQKNKDIHILAVKLLFSFLKFLFTFFVFLFYKRRIMIVDLQLCCALPDRGGSREPGVCAERVGRLGSGTARPHCRAPEPLAHVYGVEDPLGELLQLVRGVLGLLLQPQVVLAQVLDLGLEVRFVLLLLGGGGRGGREGLGRVARDLCAPGTRFWSSS